MKLKLRILLIFVLCLVMAFGVVLFFGFPHLEDQKSENRDIPSLYMKLKQASSSSATTQESDYYKNLTISSVAAVAGIKINRKLQTLDFNIFQTSKKYLDILDAAKRDFNFDLEMQVSPWSLAASWVKPYELFSENTPELGYVLRAMMDSPITHAGVAYKGTQLKIMLKLSGGQEVIFKPMRYERNYVVTGSPYAGADRHNGEIAAFYLSRLLGLSRCPLAVGRVINLSHDVKPVASESLSKTFLVKDNNTCFYGHCYYCSPSDPACAKGDIMEGAVVLMLPEKYRLKKYRSPWQRTYRDSIPAKWEQDFNYCVQLKKVDLYKRGRRLLDLIDAAIFDYLIGNADRHHYEVFADFHDSTVILLDNGKSFGNPYWDELTILAPLYQCCKIRKSLFTRLWTFVGHLGQSMREMLSLDELSPVLSLPHLEALDRRLKTLLAAIEVCFDEYGENSVLVSDS